MRSEKTLKLLELRGFDVELVEDLRGYWSSCPGYRNTPRC